MMHPRVAVLMSVIDREREDYLRRAIDSMGAQTYPHVDLHVSMSGKLRDSLAAVLEEYRRRHTGVYLYSHAVNRPLAVCLNELVQNVWGRYPYFARMDSDDESLPDRIEKQVGFLKQHREVDIVGGSIIDIDETGRELKRVNYPVDHEDIVRFFRKRSPMAHVTVMFRRSFFEKAGLYPPVPLEDALYWMQGLRAGCRFHNMPDYLVRVRRTDDLLRRRSGLRTCWQELKIRLTINRNLGLGTSAYMYAGAMFGVQLLPIAIKRVLYDKLR